MNERDRHIKIKRAGTIGRNEKGIIGIWNIIKEIRGNRGWVAKNF